MKRVFLKAKSGKVPFSFRNGTREVIRFTRFSSKLRLRKRDGMVIPAFAAEILPLSPTKTVIRCGPA